MVDLNTLTKQVFHLNGYKNLFENQISKKLNKEKQEDNQEDNHEDNKEDKHKEIFEDKQKIAHKGNCKVVLETLYEKILKRQFI